MKKIFVGNLSFQTTNEELEQLFSEAGQVDSATIITDSVSGRSRGFGFVEMSTQEEAEQAIKMLNGREVSGRDLTVNMAKPREERGNGSNRRGRGRGNFGSNRW